MQRDYHHGLYPYPSDSQSSSYLGLSHGMKSIPDSFSKFGPFESYDSRSSLGGRDLFKSSDGYNVPEPSLFRNSYDGFETSYRHSLDSFGSRSQGGSILDAPFSLSNLRPGFMDDRGRDSYSSYSSFSSSLMKPASAGSRGRGMPAYSGGAFGSRSYDAFGGSSAGRGRGRGLMGDFPVVSKPGVTIHPSVGGAGRGKKRKINEAVNKPVETVGKKAKPAAQKPAAQKPAAQKPAAQKPAAQKPAAQKPAAQKPAAQKPAAQKPAAQKPAAQKPAAAKPVLPKPVAAKPVAAKPDENNAKKKKAPELEVSAEELEKRKIESQNRKNEARREQQRRRREKNSEKYGDGYRLAFTCSFCKFRTNEEKDIEDHLGSTTHQATLDYIQKEKKCDKVVKEFLHEFMVNKFKRTSIRRRLNAKDESSNIVEKNLMEGITKDDHIKKADTLHCGVCCQYIPAVYSFVQQHLKSPDHEKSKLAYKEQIIRESVLTASSILNNPDVKAQYERFAKGENPFEIEEPQKPVEINEADKTNEQIDFTEDTTVDYGDYTANFVEDTTDYAEDPIDQIDFTVDEVSTT